MRRTFLSFAFFLASASPGWAIEASEILPEIKLPPGFKIEVYADHLTNARAMTYSPGGTLFVGSVLAGRVYAVRDEDGDFRADKGYVLASELNMPNGVAFRDGSLYVAEVHRLLRYDGIEKDLKNPPDPVVVSEEFPGNQWHGAKVIRFGPDGKLYLPVGAPCNVCEPSDWRYQTILRMNADGSGLEMFAQGIRNSVGYDWDPETKELWFTDNGRDWLGDDSPADELNHAPKQGMHFGFPYCQAGTIADPEFGSKRPCSEFTPPAQPLGPHVASLGMRFYNGTMFPEDYRGDVFIAEHGSWNRSKPIGYRITRVKIESGKAAGYEVFAEGWLANGKVLGRPVDLEVLPDGSMLVSDDARNAVYRISYHAPDAAKN